MILSLLPVLFLVAVDEPQTTQPTTPPAAQQAAAPATPAPEPKMVCKYEHVTGSRLQKTKVCRPEGESSNDQSTALQRGLNKFDARPIQAPGLGN